MSARLALLLSAVGVAVLIAEIQERGLVEALVILVAMAVGALLASEALVVHRARIGSLRRQVLIAVALAVAVVLLAVAAFSQLMFVSSEDALVVSLVTGFAGLAGVMAGRRLLSGAADDVDAIRHALAAVGEGRRDVHIEVGGNDELAALAGDANAMIARLAAEERARRSLIAAVSHDLRTPMTSLRVLANAIQDGVVDLDERHDFMAGMTVHIDALGSLIDDLFELSRLEAGDIAWSTQPVELPELVHETVDAMRPQGAAKAVTVETALSAGLAPVLANPEKVQRVLFNLIDNAIHHTPAHGTVTVLAEPNGTAVEVEVADTGSGIPAARRSYVFEAFTRGDEARSGDGAGLGLAIARALVEAQGGGIWLADATAGTRVRFSLPYA
jgi:signal transduction histidine kinase